MSRPIEQQVQPFEFGVPADWDWIPALDPHANGLGSAGALVDSSSSSGWWTSGSSGGSEEITPTSHAETTPTMPPAMEADSSGNGAASHPGGTLFGVESHTAGTTAPPFPHAYPGLPWPPAMMTPLHFNERDARPAAAAAASAGASGAYGQQLDSPMPVPPLPVNAAAVDLIPSPQQQQQQRSACVACHRRKVSCVRTAAGTGVAEAAQAGGGPGQALAACTRCVAAGVVCQERDSAEVAAAKARRSRKRSAPINWAATSDEHSLTPSAKQRSETTSAHTPLPVAGSAAWAVSTPPVQPMHSHPPPLQAVGSSSATASAAGVATAATPLPPGPADTKDAVRYSSLYLSSLQRHSVLSGWRQLDLRMAQLVQSHRSGAAPLGRATRVVLAQCVAQQMHHMALLADHLTAADFQLFMQPLRAEMEQHQQHAPPSTALLGNLPLWLQESSRPFFLHFLHDSDVDAGAPSDAAAAAAAAAPSAGALLQGEDLPEFRSELMANSAAQLLHWSSACSDALMGAGGQSEGAASLASLSLLSDPAVSSMLAGIDCYQLAAGLSDAHVEGQGRSAATAWSPNEQSSAQKQQQQTSLQRVPSSIADRRDRSPSCHALWCSWSHSPQLERSGAAVACSCSSAIPLLIRVGTNASFGCLFGWRLSEVRGGLSREGSRWLRRLYAEAEWEEMVDTAVARMAEAARAINGFIRGVQAGMDTHTNTAQTRQDPAAAPSGANGAVPEGAAPAGACPASGLAPLPPPPPPPPRRAYSRFCLASNRWGAVIPCSLTKWSFAQALRFQYVVQWQARVAVAE